MAFRCRVLLPSPLLGVVCFAFNKGDLSFVSVSYRVSREMTHLSFMFIQVF
ncbi:unnamed protein product, partial [Arabidopsis halleri]